MFLRYLFLVNFVRYCCEIPDGRYSYSFAAFEGEHTIPVVFLLIHELNIYKSVEVTFSHSIFTKQ